MFLRTSLRLALLAGLAALGACKANPHDNARPPAPDPASEKPVMNHRFDGGESSPYLRPGEKQGGGEGGEAPAKAN